jgi:hypothetical protein
LKRSAKAWPRAPKPGPKYPTGKITYRSFLSWSIPITTFAECHGEELSQVADLIGQEAEKHYIYGRMHDREGEEVFVLPSAFIEQRRDELVALLEAYLASGTPN